MGEQELITNYVVLRTNENMELLFGDLEIGQLDQLIMFYKEDFDIHNYDKTYMLEH